MRLDHLLSKENRPRGWFYPVRLDLKLMMLFDFEGLEKEPQMKVRAAYPKP